MTSVGLCVAGEFGTTFTTNDDKAWLHDFSQWKNNIAGGNDGLHNNVNSYFYWYFVYFPVIYCV